MRVLPIFCPTMVFRAKTLLSCFLAASAPGLVLAQVMEHGHEHVQAELTGHGHSHEDADVPHHEHEKDGSPIPPAKSAEMVRVVPSTLAKILIQPTDQVPFASGSAEIPARQQTLLGFLSHKERIPPPNSPAPGDTLPLLI